MDGTDGPTDTPSYRDARTHIKMRLYEVSESSDQIGKINYHVGAKLAVVD